MKKDFEVLNIRCSGCSNTIEKTLSKSFDGVSIDIENSIVSVNIKNEEEEINLIKTLKNLGYPLKSNDLGGLEKFELKARSFASCAIGKFSKKKGD